jgi:CDP-glucose 4,6-dehydratase
VGIEPGREFWSGKRIFITGHSGFKGAWLSFWLSRLGAVVTALSLPPDTEPNLFDILDVRARVWSHFADVRDLGAFREVARRASPEIFFHLAAQAQVRDGYADPVGTFATNVMGTVNALQIARELRDLRAMVVVTSDKCYRNDNRAGGYGEDDLLGGDDPYSCSKACAELVSASYRESFFEGDGCVIATARAGNVIGGGDWSQHRLVPDVVRALAGGSQLTLRNPAATRPWQHVLESLAGYLILAERLYRDGSPFARAWNFGPPPEQSATVADVVTSLYAAWNERPNWAGDPIGGPRESQRLALDASKARDRLGWRPRLTRADAIAWTADWYKAWHSGESAPEITGRQIARYEERTRAH